MINGPNYLLFTDLGGVTVYYKDNLDIPENQYTLDRDEATAMSFAEANSVNLNQFKSNLNIMRV